MGAVPTTSPSLLRPASCPALWTPQEYRRDRPVLGASIHAGLLCPEPPKSRQLRTATTPRAQIRFQNSATALGSPSIPMGKRFLKTKGLSAGPCRPAFPGFGPPERPAPVLVPPPSITTVPLPVAPPAALRAPQPDAARSAAAATAP